MKYVSPYLKISVCLLTIILLAACGSQRLKTVAPGEVPKPELIATLEYLPVLEKGDEGKYLAYEADPNPYVTRNRINKGSVASFIEARKAFQAKNYDAAEKMFRDLAKLDKSLSGPWLMLGNIALEKNDPVKAQEYYAKALTVNKDNIGAWLRLAYVQRVQGEYLTAQNTYVSALKTWRDCPEAHLNLAILYDLYLNLPIRAQRHMEAYLFLSHEPDMKAVTWLSDLQARTGLAVNLPLKNGLPDQSLLVSK